MPTLLPRRRELSDSHDPHFRNVMVAAALLLMVVGLICEKFLPPTPGYSLARSSSDIQLSP